MERPGYFGSFGGQFVAETLMPALAELEQAWGNARRDPSYRAELEELLGSYAGRPTPLSEALRLSDEVGARVLLKREDLCHTGAHKITNALGQALLARRMGKRRIIAETGAGQHGVATATVCALLGLKCEIYMGSSDTIRQAPNVQRMRWLGAEVHAVDSGSRTLKDAMNEALRDWVTNVRTTHYLVGSVAGPHPYPTLVAELVSVIGREARAQVLQRTGGLPDAVVACVGGGSNAIGIFRAFLQDDVALFGVEAGGEGIESGRHSATLSAGRVGVLHGAKSYVLQDEHGQISEAHSIAAGLDYPGVGPEHAALRDSGRARYVVATDEVAIGGFRLLARTEGILCALETAHAVGMVGTVARELRESGRPRPIVLVNVSGRGDKDLAALTERTK